VEKVSGGTTDKKALTAPEPLAPDHELDTFESGVATLDEWLKRRARRNEAEGASRTFVVCVGRRVVGYYSLAAGSILHTAATGKVRGNMPDPVPILLLGRLAIEGAWHRKGPGADLLSDAVLRAIGAAKTIGVRAILVHAISDEAKAFYEKHGFRSSPVEPMTLMITIEEAQRMLGQEPRAAMSPLPPGG
jgi:GNAT superfamily N-acetyltransferase